MTSIDQESDDESPWLQIFLMIIPAQYLEGPGEGTVKGYTPTGKYAPTHLHFLTLPCFASSEKYKEELNAMILFYQP